MRNVFCLLTALALSLLTAQAVSLPFEQTYKSAPLYEVLQDLESHFGLSFLYRPSDIAAAQPITVTLRTNDARKALQQVLGESLQYTERNGILIITKVPPKPKKPTPTRARSIIMKETPQIIVPDTLPEEEPREAWQAIPLLKPGEKLFVSPIDTIRIREVIRIAQTTPNPQNIKKTSNPRKTRISYQQKGVYLGLSAGYGSAINGQFDVRYNYYFNRNWGIGGGINFSYSTADSTEMWRQEARIGIPIVAYTRWPLSPKWGVHGTLGVAPMFKIYNNGFADSEVDIVPIAELDAMYMFAPRATLFFGIYARFGALAPSFDPWAVGLHLAFLIGK